MQVVNTLVSYSLITFINFRKVLSIVDKLMSNELYWFKKMHVLFCCNHTVMEDPPRPPMDSARSLEMSGYMPCRGDFDVVRS